jgi:undecaprenyl diphosphate synthase
MTGLHVAVIMDGNGRWARSRGLPRWRGHLAGVDSVRDIVEGAPQHGISTLTLYAFSSDNWKRPAAEVGRLFWLLRDYAARERQELVESGVRVTMIGRRDRIPRSALREMETTESATADNSRLHLRLAIDYSSRQAIVQGVRDLIEGGHSIDVARLDRSIRGRTKEPDLIIRTAGEKRLSDFLLWEAAYAEFYFTEKQWPEVGIADIAAAVDDFRHRDRRFGGLTRRAQGRKAG